MNYNKHIVNIPVFKYKIGYELLLSEKINDYIIAGNLDGDKFYYSLEKERYKEVDCSDIYKDYLNYENQKFIVKKDFLMIDQFCFAHIPCLIINDHSCFDYISEMLSLFGIKESFLNDENYLEECDILLEKHLENNFAFINAASVWSYKNYGHGEDYEDWMEFEGFVNDKL